jgi:hypothetical protein
MNNLFAFSGSAITGPIAPVTVPFGGASALLETPVGPNAGAGPWVTKFWFTWTCASAAIGIIETDARSTQPTSRLIITPPVMPNAWSQNNTHSRVGCFVKIIFPQCC